MLFWEDSGKLKSKGILNMYWILFVSILVLIVIIIGESVGIFEVIYFYCFAEVYSGEGICLEFLEEDLGFKLGLFL